MTHRELLSRMDAAELMYWEQFWLLEPFGDEWRQTCTGAAASMQAGGMKRKDGGEIQPEDLMPIQAPKRTMSEAEVERTMETAMRTLARKKK